MPMRLMAETPTWIGIAAPTYCRGCGAILEEIVYTLPDKDGTLWPVCSECARWEREPTTGAAATNPSA